MSKNKELFTTTLRLNLKNAQDYEAWCNLMSADTQLSEYSSYSRTIVTAINAHFARLDCSGNELEREAAMLRKIEETVRETIDGCLKKYQPTAILPAANTPQPPEEPEPPNETEEAINAFLADF